MKLKPVFGLVCCFLLAKSSFSQIEVESSLETGNTPAYYIEEILLGEGIQAFNIQFHGDSLQLGEFGNGENSNLNLNEGLMLATGDVGVADTFPNETNISAFTNPLTNPLLPNYDSALTALSSPLNTFHTAVLEFDFIPTGDTVRFNYVFASEEYNIFVCTQFNDVFGFFLSGPGIPGIVNLAKVPGTNEIVAVNNINDGKAGFGIAPSPCTYNTNSCACNPQYYVNNNYPNVGDSVQYNGFTVPLEAKHEVICGDTYHIRMAIADVADGAYDSGVFLEGGSFSSTLIEVNIATVNGDSSINEGCGEAEILFSRGDA
ncbi:MAG: choice-of-anchor L domain-containing protein, partial [Salibacteraceae bacterium]